SDRRESSRASSSTTAHTQMPLRATCTAKAWIKGSCSSSMVSIMVDPPRAGGGPDPEACAGDRLHFWSIHRHRCPTRQTSNPWSSLGNNPTGIRPPTVATLLPAKEGREIVLDFPRSVGEANTALL